MHITFSPIRHDAALTLERAGDTLIINGTSFDFAPVPEGARLPAEAIDSDWITDDVTRANGQLHITVLLPLAASAGEAAQYPAPLHVTTDGPVALPGQTTTQR